jgi:hypothetical protein
MTGFWVDAHDQVTGDKLGDGPIVSVSRFAMTQRLTKSGTWGADLAATEARINHTDPTPADRVLDTKRIVRCHAVRGSGTIELGAGIIDTLGIEAAGYGMDIGGNDLSILLGNPTVHELALGSVGSPIVVKDAVEAIAAYGAGLGLTFDTTTYLSLGDTTSADDHLTNVTNVSNFQVGDPIIGAGIDPDTSVTLVLGDTLTISNPATATASGVELHSNQVEHQFSGESVLAALILLANAVGEDWRLEGDTIVWLYRTRESCGLRAVSAVDPIAILANDDAVVMTALQYQRESTHLYNRIFPYGAGSGNARETIAGITAPLPPGYSYHETIIGANHYFGIQHDASVTADGPIERVVPFRSVVSPNEIARLALVELGRNLTPLDTYTISVEKVRADIRPGQYLYVEYHDAYDGYRPLDINTDLLIQQVQQEVTIDGAYVVGLLLSNQRRWPATVAARLEKIAQDIDTLSNYTQPSV